MNDEIFMERALSLSVSAVNNGNEPFGALLVKNGKIVMESENRIFTDNDKTCHAELTLIKDFAAATGITDLSDYVLYSSCEPCFMCSGAMVWAKLGRLVYGAKNTDLAKITGKIGCNCSKIVFDNSNADIKVTEGVLREKCVKVLEEYFKNK